MPAIEISAEVYAPITSAYTDSLKLEIQGDSGGVTATYGAHF
jgi:hypothetical protein